MPHSEMVIDMLECIAQTERNIIRSAKTANRFRQDGRSMLEEQKKALHASLTKQYRDAAILQHLPTHDEGSLLSPSTPLKPRTTFSEHARNATELEDRSAAPGNETLAKSGLPSESIALNMSALAATHQASAGQGTISTAPSQHADGTLRPSPVQTSTQSTTIQGRRNMRMNSTAGIGPIQPIPAQYGQASCLLRGSENS